MPREATDLRERIIRAAGALFIQQGFAATSIKQIAGAAGCTTASLYYYFEGGKVDILRAAVQEHGGEIFAVIQQSCAAAQNLEEFLVCLGRNITSMTPEMQRRLGWLEMEAPNLAEDQRRFVTTQIARVHVFLRETLTRFMGNAVSADALAWVIFCAFFGYQQVEMMEGEANRVPLTITEFATTLARALQPPST